MFCPIHVTSSRISTFTIVLPLLSTALFIPNTHRSDSEAYFAANSSKRLVCNKESSFASTTLLSYLWTKSNCKTQIVRERFMLTSRNWTSLLEDISNKVGLKIEAMLKVMIRRYTYVIRQLRIHCWIHTTNITEVSYKCEIARCLDCIKSDAQVRLTLA